MTAWERTFSLVWIAVLTAEYKNEYCRVTFAAPFADISGRPREARGLPVESRLLLDYAGNIITCKRVSFAQHPGNVRHFLFVPLLFRHGFLAASRSDFETADSSLFAM